MGLTLQELISLSDDTYAALGWNGGGGLEISCNVIEVGDIWLYFEIHDSVMVKYGPNLYDAFNKLFNILKGIWGQRAKTIEFCDTDDEDNQSGYYAAIELAETVEE